MNLCVCVAHGAARGAARPLRKLATTTATIKIKNENHAHKSKSSVHRGWICNVFLSPKYWVRFRKKQTHVANQQLDTPEDARDKAFAIGEQTDDTSTPFASEITSSTL